MVIYCFFLPDFLSEEADGKSRVKVKKKASPTNNALLIHFRLSIFQLSFQFAYTTVGGWVTMTDNDGNSATM